MTKPVTVRYAVAALQLAAIQLIEAAGVSDVDLTDLTVHLDGRSMRVDIARVSEDGRHIAEWLRGYSVDPHDLSTFGTPVGLPGLTGRAH